MVRDGHIDTGDHLGHRLGAAVQLAKAPRGFEKQQPLRPSLNFGETQSMKASMRVCHVFFWGFFETPRLRFKKPFLPPNPTQCTRERLVDVLAFLSPYNIERAAGLTCFLSL